MFSAKRQKHIFTRELSPKDLLVFYSYRNPFSCQTYSADVPESIGKLDRSWPSSKILQSSVDPGPRLYLRGPQSLGWVDAPEKNFPVEEFFKIRGGGGSTQTLESRLVEC